MRHVLKIGRSWHRVLLLWRPFAIGEDPLLAIFDLLPLASWDMPSVSPSGRLHLAALRMSYVSFAEAVPVASAKKPASLIKVYSPISWWQPYVRP